MTGPEEQAEAVDKVLRCWRQGDVSRDAGLEFMHLADFSRPHSPASLKAIAEGDNEAQMAGISLAVEEVAGFAVLTQTCDIVRSCRERHYVEVAPLVDRDGDFVEQVRRLKKAGIRLHTRHGKIWSRRRSQPRHDR